MQDLSSPTKYILDSLKDGIYQQLVAAYEHQDAKPAKLEPFHGDIIPELVLGLNKIGIHELYSHQVEAWKSINKGRNLIITTGTSSGKSLCYQLPIAQAQIENPSACALLLFPTKGLADDQMIKLRLLYENFEPLKSFVNLIQKYDGDTHQSRRSAIRKKARAVFTNPDMLHHSILPHHTRWEVFFRSLRFIVIDEAHTYRGVFGSHVANIIRRLKRILDFYSSAPQFILTSATLSNAHSFGEKLTECELDVVDQDASGYGERHYFFINPPLIDPQLGLRKGMVEQCIELVQNWLSNDVQMLLFARSRKTVEMTLLRLNEKTSANPLLIQGYRSGYLPAERRAIESGLREGEIFVVIATTALELGIDMGNVDIVILMGYPGSVSSFFQQSGRSGRRNQPSITVLVASSSPLDQFIIQNSSYLYDRSYEQALIDPDNPLILYSHLQCAAFELPFHIQQKFGCHEWLTIYPYLEIMLENRQIFQQNDRFFWRSQVYPAANISIRNISQFPIWLRNLSKEGRSVGEIDADSAYRFVHPGAIYLHNGIAYQVLGLDAGNRCADLQEFQGQYYTEPQVDIRMLYGQVEKNRTFGLTRICFGELDVIEQVVGFRKINWGTNQVMEEISLDLPETQLATRGLWLEIPDEVISKLKRENKWFNEPNDYGPNWQQIRKQVLSRDHRTCVLCGNSLPGYRLHVHHKIPFRSFPNQSSANQMNNLITLCSQCHARMEQNVRIRSGLSGFAYLFANLAPFSIMCDKTDLGYASDVNGKSDDSHARIVMYDAYSGSIGLSARIFQIVEIIMEKCLLVIDKCPCQNGCPSCIGPSSEIDRGAKEYATALINEILIAGR